MNSAELPDQMSTQTQVTDQADQQKGKNVSPVIIFGSSDATHADKSSHAMPFPKILMRMGMEIVSNARVGSTCVGRSAQLVEGVKTKYFRDKFFFWMHYAHASRHVLGMHVLVRRKRNHR
jgi:hypothetical protein